MASAGSGTTLNGPAPRCEHLDGLRAVPRPRAGLDRVAPLPVVRLGCLLRRLAQPACRSALPGDRPPDRGRGHTGPTNGSDGAPDAYATASAKCRSVGLM